MITGRELILVAFVIGGCVGYMLRAIYIYSVYMQGRKENKN